VVAVLAVAAGKPRLLPVRYAAEERLRGRIQPGEHVVQHVAVEGGRVRQLRTQRLQLGFLLVAREGDTPRFVQGEALFAGVVVERARARQDAFPVTLLCGRRPLFLLKRLAHRLHVSSLRGCLLAACQDCGYNSRTSLPNRSGSSLAACRELYLSGKPS